MTCAGNWASCRALNSYLKPSLKRRKLRPLEMLFMSLSCSSSWTSSGYWRAKSFGSSEIGKQLRGVANFCAFLTYPLKNNIIILEKFNSLWAKKPVVLSICHLVEKNQQNAKREKHGNRRRVIAQKTQMAFGAFQRNDCLLENDENIWNFGKTTYISQ